MEPSRSDRPADAELSDDDARAVQRVVQRLGRARRVLAVTGAGMSADSGLPTYRGADGLYNADRTTSHGHSIEAALSGSMLAARPEVAWHHLLEIERASRGAEPNRGHRVLAEMEGYFDAVWVLTQNVDGLHQAAGSRHVIDVHGDLHELRCTRCRFHERVADYSGLGLPPLCPDCGGVLRPDVVLFGEHLPEAKLRRLEAETARGFDVVFSIGTSSVFDYIVAPLRTAQAAGKTTVEINPDVTAASGLVDVKIHARAAVALDRIWEGYLAWWPWK
ncbi:MAG: NAD-dependent deacylase [Paludisphaera borealis]|uniref:SIR2 family NAD-dependent protein deacylase n=1 Tax=Paludisphaera borealis TaxID=1387353 RepID=UPI00284FEB56|nr:NAD-dependent deacylase [Paludisphaera borealis]MDR3621276.1 NAD-dependent deacylase [Paludisphaera borealis]